MFIEVVSNKVKDKEKEFINLARELCLMELGRIIKKFKDN
jgi:hypothetical protein